MLTQASFQSLLLLLLYLMTGHGQDGRFSGPLKPMTFSIAEGEEKNNQVIFQFKTNTTNVKFQLSGETDGIFHIHPDGILYYNGFLDRETRAVHRLQVEVLDTKGTVVEGPVPITIKVEDINDNRPVFLQSSYHGTVRQNSRPGKPFMYVNATDRDDPTTPHAHLFYRIAIQLPKINDVMYFQINNQTGGISLTPEGSQELDPFKNAQYDLVVSVMDMGGQSENSFSDTTSVNIVVEENIWKAPAPVSIKENSTEPHPLKITQVRWNDPGAHYSLVEKEKLPRFPFTIDQDGIIYVTQPLDREEKDSYVFYAVAKDENGRYLAKPLEIYVEVTDINDNPPVCPAPETVFEVQENEIIGSNIGVFRAYDMDQKDTASSFLQYAIVEQSPLLPSDDLFIIQNIEGIIQLAKGSLRKQDTPQYHLKVQVSDPAFKTICDVTINVIDINDQIPIFEKNNYGNLTVNENVAVGTTILTIQATDADEPFTGSSKILYNIVEGDPNRNLVIDTDPITNAGYVKINKPFDFETVPMYNLVIKAENPEPLVKNVQYNSSSYANFILMVLDVNEAPVFSQASYQAQISEGAPINTKLIMVNATDPEGEAISYSLSEDKQGWLRIDGVTGEIFTMARLDRETEKYYQVKVIATEKGGSYLTSSVYFQLSLLDVNDNSPRLVKDYTGFFFCYPLKTQGSVIFEATDDDERPPWGPRFDFSLSNDRLKNDWELSKINGTHAKLSTKHKNFEEKVYEVSVKISDGGKPPLENTVSFPVTVCKCNKDGWCYQPADSLSGIPTVGMAVGILLTTFLIIGVILTVTFIHLKKKKNKSKEVPQSPENTPLRT
ncbi:cadherin-17 [Dromiciops gliroides]|uniref:cadherin-17 n=1 Tax=Dromiciops gliroides TaxID=33562 RepID=UPI001CC649E7|nr:cadherin-17 [Dromiciops gliroides]